MKVTIYGTGYVGLVTGTCLAELGHTVLCIDIDANKINNLLHGIIPIYEPGLEALLKKNLAAKRLMFSTDANQGVAFGLMQFICVNTPSDAEGAADISHVLTVAKTIANSMQDYRLIVNKSTAPVGTVTQIEKIIAENLATKNLNFDVASNPEFLKEGSAVDDFLNPDRVIIGVANSRAEQHFTELYQNFAEQKKLVAMDIVSAELTKYAANAMLATRISFMNEIANLADKLGADIYQVRTGIGLDPRIGSQFIAAGCGYGGSCFPKDVKALIHIAKTQNVAANVLTAVDQTNEQQKHILTQKILQHFGADIKNKTFALWGLAFKPNTDDIREASSLVLIRDLLAAGAKIKAYDPIARDSVAKLFSAEKNILILEEAESCLDNADALIVVTEWDEFRQFDLAVIKQNLNQAVIFDGRNIFALNTLQELGFRYYGVGRSV